MRLVFSVGRDVQSLLADEQIYYTSFLRSLEAGRFELNDLSVPVLVGYYWVWKGWSACFGTSLFAARSLATVFSVLGIVGGAFLIRELGVSRIRALTVSCLVLGIPAVALAGFFITDGPVFAGTIWAWYFFIGGARRSRPAFSLVGFAVAAYTGTIRQTAIFTVIGGALFLLLADRATLRSRLLTALAAVTALTLIVYTYALVSHDPLYYSADKILRDFHNFSLAQGGGVTLGKTFLLLEGIRGALVVSAGPALLLGILTFRRCAKLGLVCAGLVALPLAAQLYSVGRRTGIGTAILGLANRQFTTLDYGGPNDGIGTLSLGCIVLATLGIAVLALRIVGFGVLVARGITAIRQLPRSIAIASAMASLPPLATLAASAYYGFPFSPRYLTAAFVPVLLLWVYYSPLNRLFLWLAVLFNLLFCLSSTLQYHDSLVFSELSWTARQAAAGTDECYRTSIEPGWYAGHSAVDRLRRGEGCGDRAPLTITLKRHDPCCPQHPVGWLAHARVWLPPKEVGYEGIRSDVSK
jgi:hypothetical protein